MSLSKLCRDISRTSIGQTKFTAHSSRCGVNLRNRFLLIGKIAIVICLSGGDRTFAQIVPDGTTPDTRVIGKCHSNCQITGGTVAGNNLFHSFSQFNVDKGETVRFLDPGVSNIFTRITGNNITKIFGTLGIDGGSANLFLINPNGFIFGKGAVLDLKGSFVTTTASSISFGDRGVFSASSQTGENLALLTVNPNVFLFDRLPNSNHPSIHVQSGALLSVADKQNLVLLGTGNHIQNSGILIQGSSLSAPNGQIQLVSVGDRGKVGLDSNWQLTLPDNLLRGDIAVIDKAKVNVTNSIPTQFDRDAIKIKADRLTLDQSSISSLTTGNGKGGNISIDTDRSTQIASSGYENVQYFFDRFLDGTFTIQILANLAEGLFTATENLAQAGTISIDTNKLTLNNGGAIATPTLGTGNSGNVIINAQDTIDVNASAIATTGVSSSTGKIGNIDVNTKNLFVRRGGFFATSTLSGGNAGNLIIQAKNIELSENLIPGILRTGLFTNTFLGVGNAGKLTIHTSKLTLDRGAEISATSGIVSPNLLIPGFGKNGEIEIIADDSIVLQGESSFGSPSRIFNDNFGLQDGSPLKLETGKLNIAGKANISASTLFAHQGGDISIHAHNSINIKANGYDKLLEVVQQGLFGNSELSLSNFQGGIYSISVFQGNGGNIKIATDRLNLHNGAGISTAALDAGEGGSISIKADRHIKVNASTINTSTINTGNAGNLKLKTETLNIANGGFLSTSTIGSGQGGNIDIQASKIDLTGIDSNFIIPTGISTNSVFISYLQGNSPGNSGNITIDTKRLNIGQDAFITTQSGANVLVANQPLVITQGGVGGDITIRASDSIEISDNFANNSFSAISTGTFTPSMAGNLTIDTNRLIIKNQAKIDVGSEGLGKAGNLAINTRSIDLNNQGKINGGNTSGDGGNLALNSTNSLFLFNESEISTNAGTLKNPGNGGNIKVDTNLLVLDNSKITANTFQGNGGNITVNAQGIFVSSLFPERQIQADSQLGIDGQVNFNTLELDAIDSLIELPQSTVDVAGLITQTCNSSNNNAATGVFNIIGRGGLPIDPSDSLGNYTVLPDFGDLESKTNIDRFSQSSQDLAIASVFVNPTSKLKQIAEAQDWIVDEDGTIVLTANLESHAPELTNLVCTQD